MHMAVYEDGEHSAARLLSTALAQCAFQAAHTAFAAVQRISMRAAVGDLGGASCTPCVPAGAGRGGWVNKLIASVTAAAPLGQRAS